MPRIGLAIVGGGPTCTYVLERLAALTLDRSGDLALDLVIYDHSGEFGSGAVHSPKQTTTSYLNRIVGQVAFAADESVIDAGPLLPRDARPTLLDWCRARYAATGDPAYDLVAEDWPKRYLHGLALQDQFTCYIDMLRGAPGVSVDLRRADVTDLVEDGDGFLVVTADGDDPFRADYVLLLTGHSTNRPETDPMQAEWARFTARHDARLIPSAYPMEETLHGPHTGPGSTVACLGMGLTGIDVLLYLTEGRGGRFTRGEDGTLRYQPCGQEPDEIVAFSRNGLFTFARPYNQKERDIAKYEYRGVFLTNAAVQRLRDAFGLVHPVPTLTRPQLDFERHVFPLAVLEMALIYYSTLYGDRFRAAAIAAAGPAYERFLATADEYPDHHAACAELTAPVQDLAAAVAADVDAVLTGRRVLGDDAALREAVTAFLTVLHDPARAAELLAHADRPAALADAVAAAGSPHRHPLSAARHRFSWAEAIEPVPANGYATAEEYHRKFLDFLDADIRWAAQGNLSNPGKAAADAVWRDLRGVMIDAVDFGGLRAGSHRVFLDVYTGHHNRLCQGASCEAMEKVVALIRAGYVDVTVGPQARVTCDEETGKFRISGPVTGVHRLADALVDARVQRFDAARDVSALYPNLLRRGLIRQWTNPGIDEPDFTPGGLDLTPQFHPVRADGTVERRVTVLGPPSEGVMYHQIGALRPNKDHHVIRDILSWTNAFLPHAAARTPERVSP
ncbi:FAD/NAD(P)-binding protein [Dactylosporangium aurantiacum]|uniref:FAD/NAD(P)-binding protein n=1 Tax=Dactylosporangium aurantiacum TaxID=35754 RepID=A0A9Q9IPW7_9ACTN|nr:FAD/NAD(P)-binding protein [Dactylosporangium aurantiacum]MDG6103694.1 FAD/NAD(P)-binding protein [Dactylosporangium aurantiacum]UWZ59088.1 FAD/NAD(P)-binding protein [Dactylosporangium aurantiacum]